MILPNRESTCRCVRESRLGRIIQLPGFVDELRSAEDSRRAYETICSADERVGVI